MLLLHGHVEDSYHSDDNGVKMCMFIFSAGHLSEHIRAHPSHRQYYSHKLKRLVRPDFCRLYEVREILLECAVHFVFVSREKG